MMNQLPTNSQIYSMLIPEEKQREVKGNGHFLVEFASLSIDAYKRYQMRNQSFRKQLDRPEGMAEKSEGMVKQFDRRTSLLCNYCKKPGHSIDKYYRLHSFPPNLSLLKEKG